MDTRVGTIGLAIPTVRGGSYFPRLLEPRRRAERPVLSVAQEAYVAGVSTPAEDLVEALGVASLPRREVSRICAALDAEVAVPPPLIRQALNQKPTGAGFLSSESECASLRNEETL